MFARPLTRNCAGCKTDYIGICYAHRDDPSTPLEETLGVFDELARAR
jgi:aryl-alcohol dehydrogenase-like predicted oxidoreductase